ncbi:protein LTV1 [Tripterygium wilfordii]|uniref:Protein LTV1 n=1 Tax=Tripterygium wilfordii TaxID=458696 RepID=A0A7J7DRK0_TRIWF|nr:protein LTV1 [Tripterygium wilfordii]
MGKKKFFDKKKSATFQLIARDSSDPYYRDSSDPYYDNTAGCDRVFVRIDNNPYSVNTFDESVENLSEEENPDSKFVDAPDDDGGHAFAGSLASRGSIGMAAAGKAASLPEHIRREILELGFPDDGYNYLIHMREIKNTGGGSMFYHNLKLKLRQLPRDVRAYDASRVQVSEARDDSVEQSIYSVASETVGVRLQKAVDPEVAELLDDTDLSRFNSDVEDLEEDFVIHANFPEGGQVIVDDNKLDLVGKTKMDEVSNESNASERHENALHFVGENQVKNRSVETVHGCAGEESQACCLLDKQFDLLEHQEYGSEGEV